MHNILTKNQISPLGLDKFPADQYQVGDDIESPAAILLRSFKMSEDDLNEGLLAIGRAGAGVNNIPVPACTDRGVVVFNTPGANANAVKELVNVAMLLSARGIVQGIGYVESQSDVSDHGELSQLVEGAKKNYKGSEIAGKTLGVIGLGAIGSLVADLGIRLGMDVLGYDPVLSIDGAWQLSSAVAKVDSVQGLLARSDYISLHVPVLDETREMINAGAFEQMKQGAALLNFARAELVSTSALIAALESDKLASYVTDFPVPELIGVSGAIQIPHLGASTAEAEDNCAVMVADQVLDFLEDGNIQNSVNFPAVRLDRSTPYRIAVTSRSGPEGIGDLMSALADEHMQIADVSNRSRDDITYSLMDLETEPGSDLIEKLASIEGVIGIRVLV